ncbi:hypothetical protein MHUMG1_02255 [Metarhizium humberi]|uniref:Uncharacterized protein n=1 Tax=Metarhizium humberi TaxID=2596975 RepID=A0A9P8MFU5_9HYPO|nr:hypothetical protein MHUMG1_02255 [Metarhizium humberi]
MKYIQLALATFAGLALAAPQNALVKPTLEEISGDKEMAVNDIPRLCEKNGGCAKCFYDKYPNKNADIGSHRLEMAMLSTT